MTPEERENSEIIYGLSLQPPSPKNMKNTISSYGYTRMLVTCPECEVRIRDVGYAMHWSKSHRQLHQLAYFKRWKRDATQRRKVMITDGRDDKQLEEFLDYFWPHPYPRSHPPIQVTFSNGIPESKSDDTHKIFVIPYSTFKQAISNLINQRVVEELERLIAADKAAHAKDHVLIAYRYAEDRIAELKKTTEDR